MLLDFAKIPVEPVANMRGGQGTVLLQKTVQGPVKVMRGVLPPGATMHRLASRRQLVDDAHVEVAVYCHGRILKNLMY